VEGARFRRPFGAALALGVALLGSIVLLELGAHTVHYAREGRLFPRTSVRDALADPRLGGPPMPGGLSEAMYAIHPYLGFVHEAGERWPRFNAHGFPGPLPIVKRSPSKAILAITGGSTAVDLCLDWLRSSPEALVNAPPFRGREIVVLCLSLYGYRQPQQLQTLSYFLAHGAQFDLLINLDGFNELALPLAENWPAGVYPFFPRVWPLSTREAIGPRTLVHLARIQHVRLRRQRWRRVVSRFPLRESAFALYLGRSADQRLLAEEVALQTELARTLGEERRSFQSEGPEPSYRDESELLADAVNMWSEASVQMAHLAAANGFRYFHFLQPNPHVEGAKPLSQVERAREVGERQSLYRKAVRTGHAIQRLAGSELRPRGVAFTDLTMLFRDVPKTVYRDSCCHLNSIGSSLLTQAIIDEILRTYSAEPTQ
jgi:hypothetical protein